MMGRGKALNRHHRNRIFEKRKRQERQWVHTDEPIVNTIEGPVDREDWVSRKARHRINTGTLCSCPMCGNPRKYAKGKENRTFQELKNEMLP
jgi:hypothetical protein